MMTFTDTERALLRIVQKDLPDSLTPYADMAHEVGTDEATVIALLSRLKADGAIRRFGASIKHQKTGWSHNAMVAWRADASEVDKCGERAAQNPHVSHCYYRPLIDTNAATEWPYTLFTMVHGRSAEECRAVIRALQDTMGLSEYAVLDSIQELKKTSMTYF